MSVLFTSDLHLGHNNSIAARNRNEETCGRSFSRVEEMNEFLIEKWNDKVNDGDEVYILGDLSYRSGVSVRSYLEKLKGR